MSKPDCNVCASKDQVKPYYVYIHRRADDGRVFYVGKGKRRRAWDTYRRNRHWNHTVEKHGFTVHIVMMFTNEQCAFSFERALISHYGRADLCNMTDGGEGISGVLCTDNQRLNMSKAKIGKKLSEEHRANISKGGKGRAVSEETRKKISEAHKGKVVKEEHRANMSRKMTGRKVSDDVKKRISNTLKSQVSYNHDHTVYDFVHKDFGLIECTKSDLVEVFNLHNGRANVYNMANGKIKSYKGWRLA